MLAKIQLIVGCIGPHPVKVVIVICIQFIGCYNTRALIPGRYKGLAEFIIVVHTEVRAQGKILDWLNLQVHVTENSPVLMLIILLIVLKTNWVWRIIEYINVSTTVSAHAVIDWLCRMLLDKLLFYSSLSYMLSPIVDGNTLAYSYLIVEELIIGCQTGVETLVISIFQHTILIYPVD